MIKDIPYIQKCILSRLIGTMGAKYSEINTQGFENDLFNYHLQALVKKGLVNKTKNKLYSLSNTGITVIVKDYPINQESEIKEKFRVNITTILTKKIDDQIFIHIHKRKRRPFYGDWSTTGGSVKNGEHLVDASIRTIKEKTGLTLINPKIVGCTRLIEKYNGNIFQELFLFIGYCNTVKGEMIAETKEGLNKWIPIDEFKKYINDNKSIQSKVIQDYIVRIAKGCKNNDFVFAEEEMEQKQL